MKKKKPNVMERRKAWGAKMLDLRKKRRNEIKVARCNSAVHCSTVLGGTGQYSTGCTGSVYKLSCVNGKGLSWTKV